MDISGNVKELATKNNTAAMLPRLRATLALFSGRDDMDSHRIRLILAVKEVAYDLIITDTAKPSDNFVALNANRPVPNLVDRDFSFLDVNVISEYLDERYPHPPLLPVEPLGRARIRLGIQRIESDWLPWVPPFKMDPKQWSRPPGNPSAMPWSPAFLYLRHQAFFSIHKCLSQI